MNKQYSEGDEQIRDWEQILPARERVEEQTQVDPEFDRLVKFFQTRLTEVESTFALRQDGVQTYYKSKVYRNDRIEIAVLNNQPVFIVTQYSTSDFDGHNAISIWTGNPEKAGLTPIEYVDDDEEGYF